MDETVYVILKVLFGFALEVWFSIDMHNQNKKQTIGLLLIIFNKVIPYA